MGQQLLYLSFLVQTDSRFALIALLELEIMPYNVHLSVLVPSWRRNYDLLLQRLNVFLSYNMLFSHITLQA